MTVNPILSPLAEGLAGKHLILASHSPRRRQLIADCGLECEIALDYEVEETYPSSLPVKQVAGYLARLKSDAYPWPITENDILITADTVVIKNNMILGKPHSRAHALNMLHALSSSKHHVVTGVVLRSAEKMIEFAVSTDVWFRELADAEIQYYVDTMKPYDKAGAYGIQEWIGTVAIERIEGSFYNVMGLPTETLYVRLREFI